jgi:hypothetical protein
METILIIAILIFAIGLAFGGKEEPTDLPPFTKEEAEKYYNENFK